MQPDRWIRRGGIAVLGLYLASAGIYLFAHVFDKIRWWLLPDPRQFEDFHRLTHLVTAGCWNTSVIATALSFVVCVYGFRHRKALTRSSRAIVIACAVPAILSIIALALLAALIVILRNTPSGFVPH